MAPQRSQEITSGTRNLATIPYQRSVPYTPCNTQSGAEPTASPTSLHGLILTTQSAEPTAPVPKAARHRHQVACSSTSGGAQPTMPSEQSRKPQDGEVGHNPVRLSSEFTLASTLHTYFKQAEEEQIHLREEECDLTAFDASNVNEVLESMQSDGLDVLLKHLEDICKLRPQLQQGPTIGSSNTEATKKPRRGGRQSRLEQSISGGDGFLSKFISLNFHAYRNATLVQQDDFSIIKNGSYTTTGWHGRVPPIKEHQSIDAAYNSGKIKGILAESFYPVRYDMEMPRPAILLDGDGRTYGYRTTQALWMEENSAFFHTAVETLLRPHLNNPKLAAEHRKGSRGPHFPCIIGHYRQYTKTPLLTQFHTSNLDAVHAFCEMPIIKRITGFVTSIVLTIFPGVAVHFLKSAVWHYREHEILPLFGVFWNLYINGIFPGQKNIHTKPHADPKNIVGICAVVVYLIPGKKFNHKVKAWLVLWEAGVAIELPPWVAFLYPSSLLYHFNMDIDDIEFVLTDGERPTKENSWPLGGGDEGRGSLVYFNQATMYHGAETGFDTLDEARKAGQTGVVCSEEKASEAFAWHAHTVDLASYFLSGSPLQPPESA